MTSITPTSVSPGPTAVALDLRAHLKKLRRGGEVIGVQLCVGDGGHGNTQHFSVKKHGGLELTVLAAKEAAKDLGYEISPGRVGTKPGRLLKTNKSGEPGIAFQWQGLADPVLYVVGTWADPVTGDPRKCCRSTQAHGLEGALDQVLARRPIDPSRKPVDRALLLDRLAATFKTQPEAC